MAELRVTLVQTASSRVPADNRDRLAALDLPAADLVVLPEYFARDPGRPDEPIARDAEGLDGPFVDALTRTAKDHGGTWVAGMLERSTDPDRPFNTLVVVDGDGLRGSYRKIHLYDSFGFRESDRLRAGPPAPLLVEVGEVQVGLMTCYDLRFPELARALAASGAQLLVVPAAWVAGPRKVHHWRTLATARAIEDVCYVAAVGQPGPAYTGHSVLVDPHGEVVVEAQDGEAVRSGTVDTAVVDAARTENPSLANRRADASWS